MSRKTGEPAVKDVADVVSPWGEKVDQDVLTFQSVILADKK
jgi:hypothetical protein